MTSFEDSIETRLTLSKGNADPPPTDLDYYAKPENYTGATLSLQQFMFAARKLNNSREKLDTSEQQSSPGVGATIVTPTGEIPYIGGVGGDRDTEDADPGENRPHSRKGSIQIASRRGSIQLEVKSKRKLSGAINAPNFERSRQRSDAAKCDDVDDAEGSASGPGVHLDEFYRIGSAVTRSRRPSVDEKKERMLRARHRFRHAINIVVILRKWISTLTEKEEAEDEPKVVGRTFTEIASDAFAESDALSGADLSFDVSLFKANREINISNEVKSILSIPSASRTDEQIQTALYGLQHLKSFAEYPLHMQQKLCKVAWFQQVPPKRVIIRQGHNAENFYFILAGQALVRILERNPATGEAHLRTAAIMRKGISFGELALLHHSKRTATVVSQDTVHLLTIGRDDFFDIFMGRDAPGEIPEHIKFCSMLDFMKDWPMEKLLEHPECCLFHFFKRGVVIVKDSNHSEWLYIVKSGSCQVMKQLKGAVPQVSRPSTAARSSRERQAHTFVDIRSVAKVDTGLRRPKSVIHREQTPPLIQEARDKYHKLISKSQGDMSSTNKCPKSSNSLKPGFSLSRYKVYPQTRQAHLKPLKRTPDSTMLTSAASLTNGTSTPPDRSTRTSGLTNDTSGLTGRTLAPMPRQKQEQAFVDEIELKGPVYVQVEVLKPKDVFGLTNVKFDDDFSDTRTSVSLVSNGAECIMLSKKFFMDNANELVRKMIRHQVRHYPTDTSLQRNLQSKVDWDLYKRRLVRDTKEINQFRGLFA